MYPFCCNADVKMCSCRWSLIAGRLPGRTDNEIKNYWNSYLAKKAQDQVPIAKSKTEKKPIINRVVHNEAEAILQCKGVHVTAAQQHMDPQIHEKKISMGPSMDTNNLVKNIIITINVKGRKHVGLHFGFKFGGFLQNT